jgi:hypothetical protein
MLAPPPNDVPSHLSITLDVVDKVTKILAVFIGGVWAYLNYIRGRTFKRRLEPNVSGKLIRAQGTLLLSGLVQVKNVGLSRVAINQRGSAVTIAALLLGDTAKPPELSEKELQVRSVFEANGWIEPGEQIQESFLLVIPEDRRYFAFHLRLRIVSNGTEWNSDNIVEISPVPVTPSVFGSLNDTVSIRFAHTAVSGDTAVSGLFQNKEDEQKTKEIEAKKKHP